MGRFVRVLAGAVCAWGMVGCSHLQQNIVMADLQAGSPGFVVDATKPDDYPGFLAGEGNIMGCRYGIHHLSKGEFTPPKARVFESLLAQASPGIETRRVVLERFDVYHNGSRRIYQMAQPGIAGGLAAQGISYSPAPNQPAEPVQAQLIMDESPLAPPSTSAAIVGCKDKQEGSFDGAKIRAQDVIVTWLMFRVDDKPYVFKSYYPFGFVDKQQQLGTIDTAIRATVQEAARRIDPQ